MLAVIASHLQATYFISFLRAGFHYAAAQITQTLWLLWLLCPNCMLSSFTLLQRRALTFGAVAPLAEWNGSQRPLTVFTHGAR